MTAIEEIAAERERQIAVEGWSLEHDDEHAARRGRRETGPLAEAASCYIHGSPGALNLDWPWDTKWWKPGTYRRNLIKAAALLAAEIERLDRASANTRIQDNPHDQ